MASSTRRRQKVVKGGKDGVYMRGVPQQQYYGLRSGRNGSKGVQQVRRASVILNQDRCLLRRSDAHSIERGFAFVVPHPTSVPGRCLQSRHQDPLPAPRLPPLRKRRGARPSQFLTSHPPSPQHIWRPCSARRGRRRRRFRLSC